MSVYCNSKEKKKKKKEEKWAARLDFLISYFNRLFSPDYASAAKGCIYKGKINVKLLNAFKCLLCNVLYICSVHFLLNLGADAINYLFPRFMTESPQSEILSNSMLKIQYKHESLIFFCSKKNKTIPFSQI